MLRTSALIMVLFLILETPVCAQGFGVGMLLGIALGNDTKATSGTTPDVLYAFPDIPGQVIDPFQIQQCRIKYFDVDGVSLLQIVNAAIPQKDLEQKKVRVLQIVRVIHGDHPETATFWISYTPSMNIRSSAREAGQ